MEMQIRTGFFPAVPVLMDQSGVLDEAAQLQYANWLIAHDITGAAVWAHTGRGLLLSQEDRLKTAELWREQLGDKLLICVWAVRRVLRKANHRGSPQNGRRC